MKLRSSACSAALLTWSSTILLISQMQTITIAGGFQLPRAAYVSSVYPVPSAKRSAPMRLFCRSEAPNQVQAGQILFPRRAITIGLASAWLGIHESSAHPQSSILPPSAYITLNNGMVICRIQTGLLQLSPKTTRINDATALEEKYWEVDTTKAVHAIKELVDAGMTTFDLSGYYGSAEEVVGEFVKQHGRMKNVFFNTKWIPTGSSPKSKDEVQAAVQMARDRMSGAEGLMQFYWWDYDKPYYVGMLKHAQRLVDEGALQGVGLTGLDTKRVREILDSGVSVASVQGSFSLIDTRPRDGGLARLCREEGVGFVAHGALCGGFLSARWLGAPAPPDQGRGLPTSQLRKSRYYRWMAMWGSWELFQELLATLAAIAERKRVSVSSVALKWVLQQEGVASVVVGARLGSEAQAREAEENRQVLSEGWTLNGDDLQAISAVQERGKPLLQFLGDVGNEFHVKARGLKKKKDAAAAPSA